MKSLLKEQLTSMVAGIVLQQVRNEKGSLTEISELSKINRREFTVRGLSRVCTMIKINNMDQKELVLDQLLQAEEPVSAAVTPEQLRLDGCRQAVTTGLVLGVSRRCPGPLLRDMGGPSSLGPP